MTLTLTRATYGPQADPADPLSAELELFARMYAEQKPAPPPPRRTAAPPPPPPASNRPLERLLQSSDAWNMSRCEKICVGFHLGFSQVSIVVFTQG